MDCESCRDVGWLIVHSGSYGFQVQACDCGKLKTDDHACDALEDGIKHARQALARMVDTYNAMPDGPLGRGLTNGHFFDCQEALAKLGRP